MVVGRLETWRTQFSGPAWSRAFEFIESLSADSEEGYTPLDGDAIFARVMSYDTRGPEDGLLEAHRSYVDIQSSLTEAEGVDWFYRDDLEVKTAYDGDNDAEFYHRRGTPAARVDLYPGMYAVLFPEDAHMAQQRVGGRTVHMKKVVVKVKLELVRV